MKLDIGMKTKLFTFKAKKIRVKIFFRSYNPPRTHKPTGKGFSKNFNLNYQTQLIMSKLIFFFNKV
jgi:hypothetical protein